MCIFVPKDEIPGGTFMKKFCIAALAATLALGTMITAQAAGTPNETTVSAKYQRSTNGGRRRGLKSPAGGAWEKLSDGTSRKVSKLPITGWRSMEPGTISVMTISCRPDGWMIMANVITWIWMVSCRPERSQ